MYKFFNAFHIGTFLSVTNGTIKDGVKDEEFDPYMQQQQQQQQPPIQV